MNPYHASARSAKTKEYKSRFYRKWVNIDDLIMAHLSIQETDLLILTDRPLNKRWLKGRVLSYRRDLQNYIARDRRFLTALKPIAIELNAPDIIKVMANAARITNVGPMAAVAGAIAQLLGYDLLNKGYKQVIIENGGDIFLSKQTKERVVSIFAGNSKFSGKLNLLIKADNTPCGICTSSATFGHSLSFGNADCVVILARDAALADATATAVCNLIKSRDNLKKGIKFARNISGVFAALIVIDDYLSLWGDVKIKNYRNEL